MAITQFVDDLLRAISDSDRSAVTNLLNNAGAADWTSAGTDISHALQGLSRSMLTYADIASFSKTIVEKGTVSSESLVDILSDHIRNAQFTIAKTIMTAASPNELNADPKLYGDLLHQVSRSLLTYEEQAELAKIIVTKATVDSDGLANFVFDSVSSNQFNAAKGTLTAASATELKSDPTLYGDLLERISRSDLNPSQQGELATLLVKKTVVDSDSLANAMFDFIITANFNAAKSVLTAASEGEVKSDPALYGDLLHQIGRSDLTPPQKAELATLIVTKTVVGSDGVATSLFDFAHEGNYAGIKNVLTAASALELKSDPTLYGDVLQDISRAGVGATGLMTPAQLAELATLLVTKTTVDSDSIVEAAFNFIQGGNYAGAKNVLTAAAPSELKSAPTLYGDLLHQVSRSDLTPPQQADLARLIVTKTTVDSISLANAVLDFALQKNFAVVDSILSSASVAEKSAINTDIQNQLEHAGYKAGNDQINGKSSSEILFGFAGNDTIYGNGGNDVIYGGSGNDHLGSTSGNNTMYGGNGRDSIWGGAGQDKLYGGAGNDLLYGGAGNDIVRGGGENDILYGNEGNDFLYGDSGNDVLNGESGRDTLAGGIGADRFVITNKDAIDTITDFKISEKDVLELSGTLFNKGVATVDKAIEEFVIARTVGNDTIISIDADGRGAGKAVDVAVLQNVKNVDVDVWHAKGLIDIG